jgi:simple sugar transport system ATP-binding protein
MEEPTAALGLPKQRKVVALIHRLKESGVSVIFISHNLADIFAVSDRIFIPRRGIRAGELCIKSINGEEIVRLMVGG